MKKRSCSSHGSDKSIQPPSFCKEKKIFSFNYEDLRCFVGNKSQNLDSNLKSCKKDRKLKNSSSMLAHSQSSDNSNPLSGLRVPRSKKGKVTSNSKNAFNSSLLILGDETEEEKPERKSTDKKEIHSEEQDQQVASVVQTCMRVITQDTEHSSQPNSARYTSLTTTPPNTTIDMRMEMNCLMYQQMNQCYYRQPQVRNRRAISYEQSKEYLIDIDRIQIDGRTTIMIRNIPNKYTQAMLLDLYGARYKKKFDFFYLPIDYNNSCNVGYAFLNFISTKFIADFYREFHLSRWARFNSTKVCHVCYARIQGTAQLENHFEHSNVIQQKEKKFRPLIGMTSFHKQNISSLLEKQKNHQVSESDSS